MDKINVTTVSAVATSATVVQAVIPEYQKSKAVIRRFAGDLAAVPGDSKRAPPRAAVDKDAFQPCALQPGAGDCFRRAV